MSNSYHIQVSISGILSSIREKINNGSPISLTLVNRQSLPPRRRIISFPGRNSQHALQFAAFIKVLDIVQDCLINNTVITKREVYYRHVPLFRKQSVVDHLIDDLAATLHVTRLALNIVAGCKGLVYGNIIFRMRDGSSLVCSEMASGVETLIPHQSMASAVKLHDDIRWIVVVEKEAVFQTICGELGGFLKKRCVFITGKGYPDITTRELCAKLTTLRHDVRVVCLVDFDPDGYEILNTYRNGSRGFRHEVDKLAARSLGCLGVKTLHLSVVMSAYALKTTGRNDDLPLMSSRDRKKAKHMLERIGDEELWSVFL